MKDFYIQKDKQGYIVDIIETPHDGYEPVQYDFPLPRDILNGCYSWDGEDFMLDTVKKQREFPNPIGKQDLQMLGEILTDILLTNMEGGETNV
jgi:hypothetical protein